MSNANALVGYCFSRLPPSTRNKRFVYVHFEPSHFMCLPNLLGKHGTNYAITSMLINMKPLILLFVCYIRERKSYN